MLKSTSARPQVKPTDGIGAAGCGKKRPPRLPGVNKRAHSASPLVQPVPGNTMNTKPNRRCASLSPSGFGKTSTVNLPFSAVGGSTPDNVELNNFGPSTSISLTSSQEKIPQCMIIKMQRTLATKKREFVKLRKSLIQQQKTFLEMYAGVRDLESRVGVPAGEHTGDVRVVSVSTWPVHDLLLLVRDDADFQPACEEISGIFGPQLLQQLHAQLTPVPEEVLSMGAEIMARRLDLLHLMRAKYRADRPYVTNLEWKSKNTELDQETERLHRMVAGTAENLKATIKRSLELARVSWIDRTSIIKKLERVQKENMILQHKIEETINGKCPLETEVTNKDDTTPIETNADQSKVPQNYEGLQKELTKERAARETLKEVVSSAESMLRVARARIATLERNLRDTKAELEVARRKHKDLEQLYRHRETSYDARSRKLMEVSKTGEVTIEALSRQRDALELRVKELREQVQLAEQEAEARETEQMVKAETLAMKVAEQEKMKKMSEVRVAELEARVKDLEETIHHLRERSGRLVDMERRRCLDYVPSKESEPSDRETEIWKELQVTRVALSRAEEELRQSRADKENFLNSLSKIAQDGAENLQDKMATELLEKEQRIAKLQQVIDEQRENEKIMEQSMTQYENQLASLRLEVKRLRIYDCYTKEESFQELQTELLEMHMQVEELTRERTALVTAAASRALMLERHERSADLFARVTRARRDLAALLEGHSEPPSISDVPYTEIARSLSSACVAPQETWSALRAERARVLRLEGAVLAQSLQLEREGLVRTQLERRRAVLEREVLRAHAANYQDTGRSIIKNPSVIQDIFCYK